LNASHILTDGHKLTDGQKLNASHILTRRS